MKLACCLLAILVFATVLAIGVFQSAYAATVLLVAILLVAVVVVRQYFITEHMWTGTPNTPGSLSTPLIISGPVPPFKGNAPDPPVQAATVPGFNFDTDNMALLMVDAATTQAIQSLDPFMTAVVTTDIPLNIGDCFHVQVYANSGTEPIVGAMCGKDRAMWPGWDRIGGYMGPAIVYQSASIEFVQIQLGASFDWLSTDDMPTCAILEESGTPGESSQVFFNAKSIVPGLCGVVHLFNIVFRVRKVPLYNGPGADMFSDGGCIRMGGGNFCITTLMDGGISGFQRNGYCVVYNGLSSGLEHANQLDPVVELRFNMTGNTPTVARPIPAAYVMALPVVTAPTTPVTTDTQAHTPQVPSPTPSPATNTQAPSPAPNTQAPSPTPNTQAPSPTPSPAPSPAPNSPTPFPAPSPTPNIQAQSPAPNSPAPSPTSLNQTPPAAKYSKITQAYPVPYIPSPWEISRGDNLDGMTVPIVIFAIAIISCGGYTLLMAIRNTASDPIT